MLIVRGVMVEDGRGKGRQSRVGIEVLIGWGVMVEWWVWCGSRRRKPQRSPASQTPKCAP